MFPVSAVRQGLCFPCPPYAKACVSRVRRTPRLVFPVSAVRQGLCFPCPPYAKACVSRVRRTPRLVFPVSAVAKACVSSNCNTNAHIKFIFGPIFDTAIDDPEWKNPVDIDCGENQKTKMIDGGHFVKICWKRLCTPYHPKCTHQLHIWWNHWPTRQKVFLVDFCDNRATKMAKKAVYWSEMARSEIESAFQVYKMAGSYFVKKKLIKDAYWSEMTRNAIESHFGLADICEKKRVLIWNGEKCDQVIFLGVQNGRWCYRKWFSGIQNGRCWPFCENKFQDEKLSLLIVGQLMFNIFYRVHRGIVSIEPLWGPPFWDHYLVVKCMGYFVPQYISYDRLQNVLQNKPVWKKFDSVQESISLQVMDPYRRFSRFFQFIITNCPQQIFSLSEVSNKWILCNHSKLICEFKPTPSNLPDNLR